MVAEPILLEAAREAPALPAIRRVGLGWRWCLPEPDVELRVDYLRQRGAEWQGEFEVYVRGRYVHGHTLYSLNQTRSRMDLVNDITDATRGKMRAAVDWKRAVNQFCAAVLNAEREGEESLLVGRLPTRGTTYLMDELLIEGKSNLIFGPGGGGKGYLSVLLCVLTAVGRGIGSSFTVKKATPLYLDWEDDFQTMNDRVARVAKGLGVEPPAIAYKKMRGPLAEQVNTVAREVARHEATFCVVDSVSVATGTTAQGQGWDTIAHRLFDAIETVPSGVEGGPLTWALVGHVTGQSATTEGEVAGKMFGSIQAMNRARNAWELRSRQEPGSTNVAGTLFNAKWNHTGNRLPIALEMAFDPKGDAVTFSLERAAAPDDARLVEKLDWQLRYLGTSTVDVLATIVHAKGGSIRTTLNRHKDRFFQPTPGVWAVRPDPDPSDDEEPLPWAPGLTA